MKSAPPWDVALNPTIYTAAVVPVLVGTAVAFYEQGAFDLQRFLLALTGLVLVQAWINLHNDVFDAETGVDSNKPWSLVSLTGNSSLIFWLGALFLALATVAFGRLAWLLGDNLILGVSALGCLLGYAYQGPPFRLAYQGWGELISFVCFGPIAVTVSTYAQTQTWSGVSLLASLVVGSLTSFILYTHHFPQVEDDRKAGKLSPIVRWGTAEAAQRMIWLVVAVYGSLMAGIVLQVFPLTGFLMLLTFPLAWQLFTFVNEYHAVPPQVARAMPMVVQLHMASGALLTVSLVWGRFL